MYLLAPGSSNSPFLLLLWFADLSVLHSYGGGGVGVSNQTEMVLAPKPAIFRMFPVGRLCMGAKSLQSCPTLCDPTGCSPPGTSVQEILQA